MMSPPSSSSRSRERAASFPARPPTCKALRELCDQTGALLVFDEVQSGVGRSGTLYAYEQFGVTPDILTTAKALGNGYPIGAMLTTTAIAEHFGVGSHGTTYGGNPLAATVALNVIETINTPAFLARVKEASGYLMGKLAKLGADYPQLFGQVRGMGLLIGLPVAESFKGPRQRFHEGLRRSRPDAADRRSRRGAPGACADRHQRPDRRGRPHHARRRRCGAGGRCSQGRSLNVHASQGAPMHVVRPAELSDIEALETLAAVTTPGVHTLPRTREKIAASVERSLASFAARVDIPSEESYLFVLENQATGELVGTAAIHASAGSNGTYFSFRNDVIQQVSRDLNISHSVHALTLCSELTGYSQLSGFYVRERHGAAAAVPAALLSRARLLFAVLAPQRFGDRFFVPLAGLTDDGGQFAVLGCAGPQIFQDGFPGRGAHHRRRPQPHPDRRTDAPLSRLRAAAAGRRPGRDGPDPPGWRTGFQIADGRGF